MSDLRQQAVEAGAERIDDLLTMLGVDPTERQVEDVNGAATPMGDDVKTILAGAVLAAAEPFIRALVVQEIVEWMNDGHFRGAHLANAFASSIEREFGGTDAATCRDNQVPSDEWSPEASKRAEEGVRTSAVQAGIRLHDLAVARMARAALDAAVKAQPVVTLPQCPWCLGYAPGEGSRAADEPICPTCKGSGVERMVPVSRIQDWMEEMRETPRVEHDSGSVMRVAASGYERALDDLAGLLADMVGTDA